jgi:very-short-patch-repair endonuclease
MRRQIIWYNPKLKQLAQQLRNKSTRSEIILWKYLKGKQFYDYDFHRQKPIDNFIIDFYCSEIMLAIEIDGYSHQLQKTFSKDLNKETRLNELGIKVLRFENRQIFQNVHNVIRTIEQFIKEYEKTHPLPLSRGE